MSDNNDPKSDNNDDPSRNHPTSTTAAPASVPAPDGWFRPSPGCWGCTGGASPRRRGRCGASPGVSRGTDKLTLLTPRHDRRHYHCARVARRRVRCARANPLTPTTKRRLRRVVE
jgi:hypothetical protein